MSLQKDARVTLTVDGRNCGVFSKREGGGTTSDDTKYRRGGGEPKKALGGDVDVDEVKLTGLQELVTRDLIKWLRTRVGKGAAVVKEQPLDADGKAWGKPDVWTGKLSGVASAEVDVNGSDAAEFEATILADSDVA
jgi:hypothetical protein